MKWFKETSNVVQQLGVQVYVEKAKIQHKLQIVKD